MISIHGVGTINIKHWRKCKFFITCLRIGIYLD
jgi:hypothetical protein